MDKPRRCEADAHSVHATEGREFESPSGNIPIDGCPLIRYRVRGNSQVASKQGWVNRVFLAGR